MLFEDNFLLKSSAKDVFTSKRKNDRNKQIRINYLALNIMVELLVAY